MGCSAAATISSPILHGSFCPNPKLFQSPTALHFPSPSLHRPLVSSSLSPFRNQGEKKNRSIPTIATASEAAATDEVDEEVEEGGSIGIPRKQNARSAAVLGLLRSHSRAEEKHGEEEMMAAEEEDGEDQQKKKMLEKISLVSRRHPRFPGAVDFPRVEDGGLYHPVGNDSRILRQAVEVRRAVAAEILKEALRASRLSINYSSNLVSRLPDFVDRVLIEAAAMKGIPDFSHLTFNARVKRYIQSSGVAPLIKWLKHNSLSYPQIGKLICMCTGNLEPLRHLVEWLKSIHVKGKFLGVVLVKSGPVLERSMEELDEIINYLERNGVRRDWVGFVISRCPQVLALQMDELESRVKFYLEMGMNEKDFGTMVYDYPKALGFFSLEVMNSKVGYLKEFGLGIDDIGRLLAYKPQLMGCSIEERWKPLVKYLYYLGVRRDGMKRMLMLKPMVFCVDLETTIAPKVRFLQDIGIREEAIGGVLVKFPPLLTYSLYKKIRPVVIFLMTKAGVTQRDIAKVIALEPELVGCSIVDKLEVNVKYFLSLGIRLRSLGEMIADFPMLLKYNMDVLRPKYRYLRRIMVRPLQDLIEFPRFFSYSLDGRIAPRHRILVENRINFKLRYMLAGSDKDFDLRVEAAIEKRRRFESGNMDGDPHSDSDTIQLAPRNDSESRVNNNILPQPSL